MSAAIFALATVPVMSVATFARAASAAFSFYVTSAVIGAWPRSYSRSSRAPSMLTACGRRAA
jgi:hypothetical protein